MAQNPKISIQNPKSKALPAEPPHKIDTKLQNPKSKPKYWILGFWIGMDWILKILQGGLGELRVAIYGGFFPTVGRS